MANKIKRAVLCLLSASLLAVSGQTFADGENTDSGEVSSEAEETEQKTAARAKEAVEKIDCEDSFITSYLKKTGSVSDYDVYLKEKKFDSAIWEKNGGKPAKKADYTDKQKELDKTITELKRLGDITIVDTRTGKAAATFKKSSKCGEGKLWVSDGERFLLTMNEDSTKPLKIMEVISTIDDPYLFRSEDGKTLELTDSKHKKVISTYKDSGIEDGKRVFTGDNGFAWTDTDTKQVLGTFRYSAENENYRMIVSDRFGSFGLENKKTGYIWWSIPMGASRDSIATPLLADELRSTSILRYGIPENRNNNNYLRSATGDCDISVKDIKDGIRVTYNYISAGFSYPVDYTLEKDYVKASLKISDIKEKKPENVATEVTLLGSFGAGDMNEEGYYVVPDGCGALIRFNNNRTTQSNIYRQRVYGDDLTAVPVTKGAVSEQIYLPVYGIVKEDNAMLVVAAKGDTNAILSANVSRQSNSSYNLCSFTFMLRGTDDYYMSGSGNERFTVFESGDIKSDDIELRYYPISGKGADYTDIAARYRQYLLEDGGVEKRAEDNDSPLYIGLYGGVMKKKPFLGIPVNKKAALTDFSQAKDILSQLRENGVDDMAVSYANWTNNGIRSRIDTKAEPSGKLGGSSDFSALSEFIAEGGELYPVSDNKCFYSGGGYNSFSKTTVRISGSYSRIVSYDRAYGIPDGFRKNMSLLSPGSFSQILTEAADSYSSAGLSGISLSDLPSSLYGDYGKKSVSRGAAAKLFAEGCEKLDGSLENGILAKTANAYAFPYISRITDVPMTSSRYDLFDEDIPFYQLVLHGIIPYASEAVNGSPSPEDTALMAASVGCGLDFDMIYEEPSELKDTVLDTLYYADHRWWTDTAAEYYRLLSPMLKAVSGCTITDYSADGDIITTVYDNGTEVVTDMKNKTIEYNGNMIQLGGKEASAADEQ